MRSRQNAALCITLEWSYYWYTTLWVLGKNGSYLVIETFLLQYCCSIPLTTRNVNRQKWACHEPQVNDLRYPLWCDYPNGPLFSWSENILNMNMNDYHSHTLKSLGSRGNSTLFLQRSQYISLDFDVHTKEDSKWQVWLLTQRGS